jgi:predicted lipoprotein with Yx(FWY)xxD motif
MTRKHLATLASVGVIALIIAGCGSGGGGSSSGSAAPAASSSAGGGVSAASTSLGKIVVGPSGRTLYLFAKDSGTKSMCAGACASNWPPFTASSKPSAAGGIPAGSISLAKRADGAKQVTLDGHPLYYFAGDQAPGQLNGQGVNEFGGKWTTVAPSGTSVTGTAKSSSNSSNSSGGSSSSGGGYAY